MKTVLIADDEKEILEAFRLVFANRSGEIRLLTAANGREAIDLLGEESIDLVVTDLNMPVLNGFQVLAHLMRYHPRLPVIVMTAYGSPLTRDSLDSFGPLTYVEKPFDLFEIMEKIQLAIGRSAKGHVRGITLASFLQLLQLEGKSCSLRVSARGEIGLLEFDAGELFDAAHGAERGERAAEEILGWDDVEIRIDGTPRSRVRTIHRPLEQIILESAARRDEAGPFADRDRFSLATEAVDGSWDAALRALVDSIPDGVLFEEDGVVLGGNLAAAEIFGITGRDALMGRRFLDLFASEARGELDRSLRDLRERGDAGELVETSVAREDGSRLPIELRLRKLESTGRAARSAVFVRAVTPKRSAEVHQAIEVALLQLLTQEPRRPPEISKILQRLAEGLSAEVAIFWSDETGRESLRCRDIWVSPGLAASRLAEESRGARLSSAEEPPIRAKSEARPIEIADLRAVADLPRMSLAARSGLRSAVAFPVTAGAKRVGVVELMSVSALEPGGSLVAWLADFGPRLGNLLEHALQDLQRSDLIEREEKILNQICAEENRLSFLADASAVFACSLDESVLLRAFSRLAVPRLADWYVLDIVDGNGELRRSRVDHADPLKLEWTEELRLQDAPFRDGWSPVLRVVRTGESEIYGEKSGSLTTMARHDGHDSAVLEQLGFHSLMIVPLSARNRVLGAVTFVSANPGRQFGPEDLATARELAHRAALAMDNARRARARESAPQVEISSLGPSG